MTNNIPISPKHLTLVYLASSRALIGQLNMAKSDDFSLVLHAVGEVVDQAQILPNGAVAKQTFIVGVGLNMGPVQEVTVNTKAATHVLELTVENLGLAVYDRVDRSYRDFLGFENRDKVSKIQVPTTKEVAQTTGQGVGKLHKL